MGYLTKLKDMVGRWRSADPYYYECTVCERSFQVESSTCPDCGGDVERATGESSIVDSHP